MASEIAPQRRIESWRGCRYMKRMEARAATPRDRIARYRAAQRARGLRPFVLWLPDVNDPDYQARVADECRRLARLTREEQDLASGFARLAARSEGWR